MQYAYEVREIMDTIQDPVRRNAKLRALAAKYSVPAEGDLYVTEPVVMPELVAQPVMPVPDVLPEPPPEAVPVPPPVVEETPTFKHNTPVYVIAGAIGAIAGSIPWLTALLISLI